MYSVRTRGGMEFWGVICVNREKTVPVIAPSAFSLGVPAWYIQQV